MDQITLLVVDDDNEIAKAIQHLLSREGYNVLVANDGLEAIRLLKSCDHIKLLILDIMMPKLDGLSTLMKLRDTDNLPVILLSAKSEESDKVLGLSIGADDYITKPYQPSELIARVKSQLRRYTQLGDENRSKKHQTLMVGGLQLDQDAKQLLVDGEVVRLTSTELKIMTLLMSHPGMVFSAERIYEQVWEEPAHAVENTVMVHIRRIREKIEINPKDPKYLKVVWGIGYKIEKN